MGRAQQGQVSRSAADIYEEFFVPALFREPAQHVVQAADIRRGQSVLDVACGTGVLAREAAPVTGDAGKVTGLDRNDGMLAVARRLAPGIDWQLGVAEALPFVDRSFDRVFCQFGLMFFDDRVAALREMRRVMKPGGRMHVAVWDSLDHTPGYAAMVNLLHRLCRRGVPRRARLGSCGSEADMTRAEADVRSHSISSRSPSRRRSSASGQERLQQFRTVAAQTTLNFFGNPLRSR